MTHSTFQNIYPRWSGARTRWIIHNLQPAKPQDVLLILIALFRPRPSQVKSEDVTKNESSMGNGRPSLSPCLHAISGRENYAVYYLRISFGLKKTTMRIGGSKKPMLCDMELEKEMVQKRIEDYTINVYTINHSNGQTTLDIFILLLLFYNVFLIGSLVSKPSLGFLIKKHLVNPGWQVSLPLRVVCTHH